MARKPELPDAPHINALEKNLSDVEELQHIRAHLSDSECSHDPSVLHRSAVVLLAACWESVVEDLVEASVAIMVRGAGPHAIPPRVQDIVGRKLAGVDAWRLAGDGWRTEMNNHLKEVFGKTIGQWHNPKADKVDTLFETVVGLGGLSATWKWRGMKAARARTTLDAMITVRGAIAHRVRGAESVTKSYVDKHTRFIRHLACCSSNAVAAHLKGVTGVEPWGWYEVGDDGDE